MRAIIIGIVAGLFSSSACADPNDLWIDSLRQEPCSSHEDINFQIPGTANYWRFEYAAWLNDLGYFKQELGDSAQLLESSYRKTLEKPDQYSSSEIEEAKKLQALDGLTRRIHSNMIIKSTNCVSAAQGAIFRAVNDGRYWPKNWTKPESN